MFSLQNLSIRLRLYLLGLAAMLAMVGIGGFSLYSQREFGQMFSRYSANDVESLAQIAHLRAGVGNLRRFEKDMLINIGDEASVEKYFASWKKTFFVVDKALREIGALHVQQETRDALAAIEKAMKTYRGGVEGVHQGIADKTLSDTKVANKSLEPLKAAIHSVDGELDRLTDLLGTDSEIASLAVVKRGNLVQMVLSGVILLGVLGVGTYTVLTIRSILRPLRESVVASARMAGRDLSQPIESHGRDETTEVLQGMQAMQTALRDVVGSVRSSTENIATASREVAAGSHDLSSRTEQAASNLQQTASAMEELTASVRHNADSARQANRLALDAAQVAHKGGTVVGDVVNTMDRISESSRKIGDIISVIDGIAFQTNILALNAAVEAARAGEQGRGFAVVAAEVRTLAQRSAEAAREIKVLIGASAESVEAGSALVANAGATMKEIVGSIERVSQIVSEISHATEQQSTGIAQIGGAISSLDEMTQQNAALVEQSAAAAQSLQQQADELSRSVAVFKLG
ncbi:MAG: HAMP domain-containing protein [Ideonella sp.]|nr:HAMP domain-containing protein [Ideonella sp.]